MAGIVLKDVHLRYPVRLNRAPASALLASKRGAPVREVHALRGINLEIGPGERVGLIGPNGAGKTTLLRVMARIYTPHGGTAQITGRICPLFEFATGFEMDASGWDNIRTRALLLGVPHKEIEKKLPEIAEFSGLGDFLDLPVRCYSTGMFLRLAFSTSTVIDADVLLLDEVMAAGDAEFLAKARARMDELLDRARIVVFATHALAALDDMCPRAVWIHHGQIQADGPTEEVRAAYLAAVAEGRVGVA